MYGDTENGRDLEVSTRALETLFFSFSFLFRKRGGLFYFFFPLQLSFLSARNRESPCQQNDHGKNDRDRPRLNRDRQRGRDGEGGTENKEGMEKLRGIEWTGQRQGRQSKRAGRFRRLGGRKTR